MQWERVLHFSPKLAVTALAKAQIEPADLTELLSFQGYSDSEFAWLQSVR
jgi:hypothetical protein